MKNFLILFFLLGLSFQLNAQKINDSTTPLHLMKPDYDVPYGKPELKTLPKFWTGFMIIWTKRHPWP